jgi:hypothetical protein
LSACTICLPGKFTEGSTRSICADCTPGRFSLPSGSPVLPCTYCPTGKYGQTAGLAECVACAAGSFSDTVGATDVCDVCAPGKFSPAEATSCTDCPTGQYGDKGTDALQTQDECDDCAEGRCAGGGGLARPLCADCLCYALLPVG